MKVTWGSLGIDLGGHLGESVVGALRGHLGVICGFTWGAWGHLGVTWADFGVTGVHFGVTWGDMG